MNNPPSDPYGPPPGSPEPARVQPDLSGRPAPLPPQAAAPQPPAIPRPTPVVSYTILGLTVLVYLAQIATQSIYGIDLPAAYGIKANALIAQGQFWRLFTPMLLHGSILHIGFNMYALYVIGPDLERHFGKLRFLLLYVVSGFAGNVFSMIFTLNPSLGASTAIFGLLGAQGVFVYQNRTLFGSRSRAILSRILQLAAINLIIGLQPGIDNWGHVGGLIGGVAFTWLAGPLLTWEGIYPMVKLEDRRAPEMALFAAFGVGVVFGLLALGKILFGS